MPVKPTPAQARALRSLNAEYEREWKRPYLDLWLRKDGSIRSVSNRNIKTNIRISTARILLANSWIETATDNSGYSKYIISSLGIDTLTTLQSSDFISPNGSESKPIWSTADIRDALIEKYRLLNDKGYDNAPVWIFFSELGNHRYASRRVDFWCMACWKSEDYRKIAYEIKVSRADFLKELCDPTKRQFALSISNQFYFITPPDLISLDELPDLCGLIELSSEGKLITKRKAPNRITLFEFDWSFAATLGRSIFRAWRDESLI